MGRRSRATGREMVLNRRGVTTWLDPWPISIMKNDFAWNHRFMPMSDCRRLHSCWEKGATFNELAPSVKIKFGGQDHQIASLARHGIRRPAILVVDDVVYDGNHTLFALMRNKYRGPVLAFVGRRKIKKAGPRGKGGS